MDFNAIPKNIFVIVAAIYSHRKENGSTLVPPKVVNVLNRGDQCIYFVSSQWLKVNS